jgi:hypothetical protein
VYCAAPARCAEPARLDLRCLYRHHTQAANGAICRHSQVKRCLGKMHADPAAALAASQPERLHLRTPGAPRGERTYLPTFNKPCMAPKETVPPSQRVVCGEKQLVGACRHQMIGHGASLQLETSHPRLEETGPHGRSIGRDNGRGSTRRSASDGVGRRRESLTEQRSKDSSLSSLRGILFCTPVRRHE